ncbi:MAG TPA: FecR family protein [Steroidobacteraceae bacterium]|jgi:ferric-dicitrate binding protein FerR (iron transport regulator)
MTSGIDERGPQQNGPHEPPADETGIEELLRQVGARDEPAADMMREVEAAVHAEWQGMLQERRRKRRFMSVGVAASALLAIGVAALGVRYFAPTEPVQVAQVTRIDGHLLVRPESQTAHEIAVAQSVATGETIQTDDRSRAAMRFGDGVSLRLDHGTIVKVAAADELVLTAGALYIDSRAQNPQALTIRTDAGSVRHVGTQYQVRTHADEMEVSVREGRVLIANAAGTSSGVAGERIRVTPRGEIVRSRVPAHDPSWRWAAHTAPLFDINEHTFAAFADWVGRETGRKVVYQSGAAQRAANELTLRGSIEGLDPDTALSAVLSTTQLHRYQTEDESIGIALNSD